MSAVVINFSLDTKKDREIIDWLDSQKNRSAAIREALKAHVKREDCGQVTLADILSEIRNLPSKLTVMAIPVEGKEEKKHQDEPEAAAVNLNGLLGRLDNGDIG